MVWELSCLRLRCPAFGAGVAKHTRTKAHRPSERWTSPSASASSNSLVPKVSVSPAGTSGTHPSSGFTPALESARSLRPLVTYALSPPG